MRIHSKLGGWFVFALVLFAGTALAQPPERRYLGEGEAAAAPAAGSRMGQKDDGYLQPMKFILPQGTIAAIASENGFVENRAMPDLFALRPGEVYRFKIYNIPFHEGAELFPSVEVLNRTFPPEGKALDFPVQLLLTQEDLEFALDGQFVTRVVFLERVKDALPADSSFSDEGLSIDVPTGLSPVSVAETRGTVMAIIRVGSRLPEEEPNAQSPFYFGLPSLVLPSRDPAPRSADE
ncbi:MAG: hypothetical protein J6S75_05170 [Thermoguttaceae bacterium]|nr:hypothetical protein [Thermoguttaceae bacterium]